MMSQEDAAVPAAADEKLPGARTALRARFVGVGSCAPPTRVTNDMLEELVDTAGRVDHAAHGHPQPPPAGAGRGSE